MVDLNNEVLKFPCEYPIKVIGLASDPFKRSALDVVYQHFKERVSDDLISFTMSKNNKYLSITVNFTAESRKHVEAIYDDLKQCIDIVCLI
jgi:putative lipoic acid-binding regulatory protein